MLFRRMELSDFAQIRVLSRDLAQMHAQARPDIFLPPAEMNKKEFKKRAVGKDAFGIVGTDDDVLLAYCFCRVKVWGKKNKVACPRRILWIDEFFVNPAFQRQGIGAALTQHLKQTAAQLGCDCVELEVWAFNDAARDFYIKQGFSEQSRQLELSASQKEA